MKRDILILFLLILVNNLVFSQKQISGIVTDTLSRPISGVKIVCKGDNRTMTSTDRDGSFIIDKCSANDILIFSHMGYNAREIRVTEGLKDLDVILHVSSWEIENIEVVSTGYQTIAKERATGSFEHIGAKVLEERVSSSILDKLEGNVPGLQYDNRKGKADINIRGINTMSDGLRGPLIVVDNFPFEGHLEDINPNDVESVTFLKDAAASSIWGARAGNGVIVINLKKPSERFQLSFTSNYTTVEKARIKELPHLQSSDFIDVERMLFEKGFYNSSYNSPNARLSIFSPVVELLYQQQNGIIGTEDMEKKIEKYRSMDFRDDLLKYMYANENLQQYALSISNGNTRSNYRMSMSYNGAAGQKTGTSDQNISFNFQHNLRPNDKLEISTRMTLMNARGTSDGNVIDYHFTPGAGKTRMYPYASLRDDLGNNLTVPYQYNANFVDTVGQGRLLDWRYAPLDDIGQHVGKSTRQQIDAQVSVDYKLLEWLKLSVLYNYQTYRSDGQSLYKESSYYARSLINRFTQIDGDNVRYVVPVGGINSVSHGKMNSHKFRGNMAIDHNFKGTDHNIAAIMGAELSTVVTDSEGNIAYGYDPELMTSQPVDMVNFYPIYAGLSGNARIPGLQSFLQNTRRYVSVYGNGAYTYAGKYTFSLSARRDASNLFGVATNDRWNPLWSTGLAWAIGEENFLQASNWLNTLRLRTTYGHSGNSGGSSSSLPRISYTPPSSTSLTTLPRAMVTDLPNMELKWEDVRMINIGLDFSVFNNVLSGSVEYFNKKSTDLLATENVDPTLGFTSTIRNVGVLEGSGWDIRLTGRKSFGQFSFSSTIFLSKAKDKVKEYQGTISRANVYVPNAGRHFQLVEGKQLYPVFALPFEGLDPENGNPLGRLNGEISTNYLQLTRDSLQNVVYFGTALPPYHGSFRQSLSWTNFTLSFLISYKFGHYFQKPTINYNTLFNGWNGHRDYEKRWQKPGDENHTTVPSMVYPANTSRDNFYAYSEANIEKGDLIRLQDIYLSYTLRPILGRKRITMVLFSAVNNVGLLWKANKSGLDPDYYDLPPSRRYSFGLNCNF